MIFLIQTYIVAYTSNLLNYFFLSIKKILSRLRVSRKMKKKKLNIYFNNFDIEVIFFIEF